jgi:hypothetical protein
MDIGIEMGVNLQALIISNDSPGIQLYKGV